LSREKAPRRKVDLAKLGHRRVNCPYADCGKPLWTKTEIVEPNWKDERLTQQDNNWNQHGEADPTLDYQNAHHELVEKIGKEQCFQTQDCPYCRKPLWTKSKILPT